MPVLTLKWQLNAPPQTSGLCQETCLLVMVLHLLHHRRSRWKATAFSQTGGLADTNRHIKLPSLFTCGRSFAFLLCHSKESTNMRTDLKSHRSQFPFLMLQTCSDNDSAAESRKRPPSLSSWMEPTGSRPQWNAAPPIPPVAAATHNRLSLIMWPITPIYLRLKLEFGAQGQFHLKMKHWNRTINVHGVAVSLYLKCNLATEYLVCVL